jgi:hypothetical protein
MESYMGFMQSSLRNLQGVVKLNIEIADLLIDFRQDVELSILKQVQQSVDVTEPASQFVSRGVELTTMAFNRQHALERDLLARLKQFVVGIRERSRPSAPHAAAEPAREPHYATGEPVHVTTRAGDGPLVLPLKLRNHQDTPQTITLHAVDPARTDGVILPTSQIHFLPNTFILPARDMTTAYVVVEIAADMRSLTHYWTEIRVGGSDPRRFPLCLTILPPEQPDPKVSPGAPAISNDEELAP